MPGLFLCCSLKRLLKLFVEIAHGARNVDAAGDAALAVLYALDDARRLAALGTVGRLRRVHYFLAVTCFCNLGHRWGVSPFGVVSAHTRKKSTRLQRRGLTLAFRACPLPDEIDGREIWSRRNA